MEQDIQNYKMVIAYDGTSYGGWQVQPNAVSIQTLIQKAIYTITRQEITIIGSGRTDAGVHAIGQISHFKCSAKIDPFRFLFSMNSLLPRDIRILQIEPVPMNFHAQYSAISKTYHYHITLDRVQSPFLRLSRYHIKEEIDLSLIHKTIPFFLGTHDFTSFANEAHKGSAANDAIRTISQLEIVKQDDGIRFEITADGFLYKMVRNIVGTLLDVGYGKIPFEQIPEIIKGKDRRLAGQAAPPHGLFLMRVEYPET